MSKEEQVIDTEEFVETPEPPGPNDVDWEEAEATPGVGQPFIPEVEDDPEDLEIEKALQAAGVNDNTRPTTKPPKNEEEDSSVTHELLDTGKKSETEDEDFNFPEPDVPLDIFGQEETTGDEEVDVSGILKKYLGDADEKVIETAQPLAKAYKEIQRKFTEAQQEAATLQQLVEKLAAGEGGKQATEGSKVETEGQPQESVPAQSDFEMPSEEELEAIVAEEGYAGLMKVVMKAQEQVIQQHQAKQQEQLTVQQQQELERKRNEHNNSLLYDRARQLLLDRAIAQRDKQAVQKYGDEKYQPSEAEFMEIYPVLETEIELIRDVMRPDDNGFFSPEHVEYAKRIAYFDKYVEQAEKRGYERALKDIKSQRPTRVSATPRGDQEDERAGLKINTKVASPAQIKEQLDGVSDQSLDKELARLRKEGVF